MQTKPAHCGELTDREVQCLEALAEGLTSPKIAKYLGISTSTVAMHVLNARRKLGASTREQAVALAVKRHLVNF